MLSNDIVPLIKLKKEAASIFQECYKQIKSIIFTDEGIKLTLLFEDGIAFDMFIGCEYIDGLYNSSKILNMH